MNRKKIEAAQSKRCLLIPATTVSILMTLLIFLCPLRSFGEDQVKPGEVIDLGKCIAIALKNHPDMVAAASSQKASISRIGQAKSSYYPQVSINADFMRVKQPSFSSGSTTDSTTDTYDGSVTLNQLLYDFGRTSAQVGIKKFLSESSGANVTTTARDVSYAVKQSYYGLLNARDTLVDNRETVKNFEQHLDMAKKLFEAGIKPMIDVTKAEMDLSQARLSMIKAQNDTRVARLTLTNSMGIDEMPDIKIKDAPPYAEYIIIPEESLNRAYANRPDLKALQWEYDAAKRSIDYAKTGNYPNLSGTAGIGKTGRDFPLNDEWSIGAGLSIPIFTGFNVRYQVDEARSNLITKKAEIDRLKQNIKLDVQKALVNLSEIKEAITVASVGMYQAKQNREQAEGRYAEGIGNAIEVSDALTSELTAKTNYTIVQYQYWLAIAALQKAMGEVE